MAEGLPRFQRHLQGLADALAVIAYPELTVEVGERTADPPALVCHLIPGGWRDGTAARGSDDAGIVVQITCVAATWQVAAHLWDLVEARLLDGLVSVDGRFVMSVAPHGGERQVKPDHTVNPTVWTAKPHYLLATTPD